MNVKNAHQSKPEKRARDVLEWGMNKQDLKIRTFLTKEEDVKSLLGNLRRRLESFLAFQVMKRKCGNVGALRTGVGAGSRPSSTRVPSFV